MGRYGEAIALALRSLLDAGDALRGRLRTWADGMAVSCWDNVTYIRRQAEDNGPPREAEPSGSW